MDDFIDEFVNDFVEIATVSSKLSEKLLDGNCTGLDRMPCFGDNMQRATWPLMADPNAAPGPKCFSDTIHLKTEKSDEHNNGIPS